MIKLRDYQIDAVNEVFAAWQEHDNVLIVMATGTGKTETLLGVLARARQETSNFRALILAHRAELIHQPAERIAKGWADRLPVPGIVMGSYNEPDREIVVATVQTLAGRVVDDKLVTKRLDEVLSYGEFTHLIIDEAHHAVAESYQRVVTGLRENNPSLKHLGVTATPKRSDDNGLIGAYSKVAYRLTIRDAVEKLGCLVPFVGYGFELPVSMKGIRTIGDDYSQGQLDSLLTASNVEQIIIEKWREVAENRQTIIFTAGVNQAYSLARAFTDAGIPAIAADGKTGKEERAKILRDFQLGKHKVIVNCALWTEGMDAPAIACVVNAAPTKSDLVYVQRIGRGLRKHPTKSDCIIMDFAPLDGRDIVMSGDLLGTPKAQREAVAKAEDDGVILDIFGLLEKKAAGIDAEPDSLLIKVLDFFAKKSFLSWTHDGTVATATVTQDKTMCIVFPQLERVAVAEELRGSGQWNDTWEAAVQRLNSYQLFVHNGELVRMGVFDDWDSAIETAEDYAEMNADSTLAGRKKSWRNSEPSDKQIAFARRIGAYQDGMSRGQVAQAITHKLVRSALKKERVILP